MATFALLAEGAVVHVIRFVASHTGATGGDTIWHRAGMTSLAMQSLMPAVQPKRRAPVMIEIPRLPGAGVMALLAPRSKPQLVLVILLVASDTRALHVLERRREMALFAFHLGMRAEQRKAREPVIEERLFPGALVVAALAFPALLALVLVVLLVAGKARARKLVAVEEPGVAAIALRRRVLAAQRIARIARMIEQRRLPVPLAVAARTAFPVAALVCIVLAMASEADRRKLLLIQDTGMAARACREAMFALEGVFRVAVVVEQNRLPILVGMAALALRAEPLLVLVVLTVTSDALRRRALEARVAVTGGARHVAVFAGERETRLAVVEAGFLPIRFEVAIGALRTEAAFVLVVLAMTRETVRRSVAKLFPRGVTVAALDLRRRMRPLERKIRETVIEAARIERRDIHVPPFMFRMARTAFLFLEAAVESLMRLHVARDVLVAIKAQPRLPGLVEAHMALRAVDLEIRMAGDKLAGRKRALERLGPRHSGKSDGTEREKQTPPRHQYMCTAMT